MRHQRVKKTQKIAEIRFHGSTFGISYHSNKSDFWKVCETSIIFHFTVCFYIRVSTALAPFIITISIFVIISTILIFTDSNPFTGVNLIIVREA